VIEIRRVSADEWQLQRDVRLSALRDTPAAFASTYEQEVAFGENEWRARARNGLFVALDGPAPVGLAAGFRDPAAAAHHRELVSVWVAPEFRGRGIAGGLVDAVAAWARDDGARELALWVVIDNGSARASYERAGFMSTGERQPVTSGDPRIEERMVLAL
jgi:GNAT superfamily N-acetyltransferase